MELFLIRHAKAADPVPGEPDAARELTPAGIRRFRRAVRGLGALGLEFDLVLHSPLVRAVATAELLVPCCSGELRVDHLLAEPPQRALFSTLAELEAQGFGRVALVGHEPWLGEFAAWCLTGATNTASNFGLRKGGLVQLEGSPAPGALSLVAALPPEVLVATAG